MITNKISHQFIKHNAQKISKYKIYWSKRTTSIYKSKLINVILQFTSSSTKINFYIRKSWFWYASMCPLQRTKTFNFNYFQKCMISLIKEDITFWEKGGMSSLISTISLYKQFVNEQTHCFVTNIPLDQSHHMGRDALLLTLL